MAPARSTSPGVPMEIPEAKGWPFIGNLLDLQDAVPLRAIERLAHVYGPIIKFRVFGEEMIAIGDFELFDEVCDETRFYKLLSGPLAQARDESGTAGLFTQKTEETDDWQQAHRILMPAFGPLAVEEMFDEMHDVASQLVLKWAREGPSRKILATEDFSRLTLDTIALCAMDFRFNSFYQEEMHPFVKSMNALLEERNQSNQIGGLIRYLKPSYREELRKNEEHQRTVSRQIVDYRRAHPTEKKDLLNALIYGKDPRTGMSMRDDLITANMQTFLIAGHETTSGLLSFAFMLMLKNPSTLYEAQKEVDRVVGKNPIHAAHLKDLKYITGVLRETLRLCPTAPAFERAVRPENKEETPTLGKYAVPRDKGMICLIWKIQRDPKVWGEDAEEFKPERMMDGEFEKLPKNAWKPFGTGLRSCIGRAFAWQEALLAVAMILQNFDVQLDDHNYVPEVVQSLTIKPKDLFIRAALRPGITATVLAHRLRSSETLTDTKEVVPASEDAGEMEVQIEILYGSNSGTCQALAQRLSARAAQRGMKASLHDLNSATGKLPSGKPVVIFTASYEGLPPDNASRFVAWLESLENGQELLGVNFAVFGCGHSDWATTFQRIPTLVDDCMTQAGGHRLLERFASDVSKGNTYEEFEAWSNKLFTAIPSEAGSHLHAPEKDAVPTVEISIVSAGRAVHLQHNVQWAKVTAARRLTKDDSREKRHIEFQLPPGVTYTTGDYLTVLPLNPEQSVKRVVDRFGLMWDGVVTIGEGSTTLPIGKPIPIFDLLRGYVEISLPATRRDIKVIASLAQSPSEKGALQRLAQEAIHEQQILERRASVLDLLERYPSVSISFSQFLAFLPPLRPRYYSISSSSLADPIRCSLTYNVIDTSNRSSNIRFLGVAGTYLRSLNPGDQSLVEVCSTNKLFRPPVDPSSKPMVMLCAGSGIAPFRGFVQERAILIKEGNRQLAPALLYVGCRSPDLDCLYKEEMEEWAQLGAVDVRYTFSQKPDPNTGCKYVGERLFQDKVDILKMWDSGACFYVCGAGAFARGVSAAVSQILKEGAESNENGSTNLGFAEFIHRMRNKRFLIDIFD